MAALDGKITIERGLRPCITTVFEKVKNEDGGFSARLTRKKGLFHCWSQKSFYSQDEYGGGNTSATFAIVEYEDGTIHEVEPMQIRFVDNAMSEYAFPEMEDRKNEY